MSSAPETTLEASGLAEPVKATKRTSGVNGVADKRAPATHNSERSGANDPSNTSYSQSGKKPRTVQINGLSKSSVSSELIVEDFVDKDGERLTSLKLAWDDDVGQRQLQRRESTLISGRRAGAGWDRSQ